MDESAFKIIRWRQKTPDIAMCQHCEIKFFTVPRLFDDPARAEKYLRARFFDHRCKARTLPVVSEERAVNQ